MCPQARDARDAFHRGVPLKSTFHAQSRTKQIYFTAQSTMSNRPAAHRADAGHDAADFAVTMPRIGRSRSGSVRTD